MLQIPPSFFAISQWYERFEQLEDAEVCRLLTLARQGKEETAARDRARTKPQR
jgi:predicted phosphoribosyltransferase